MRWELLVLAFLLAPALASAHVGHGHADANATQPSPGTNTTAPPPEKAPGPWPPPPNGTRPGNATGGNASAAKPSVSLPSSAYEATVPSPALRGWPGFKADPERTGFTPAKAPAAPLRKWDSKADGGLPVVAGPVVAHNLVVFAGLDEQVHAVDLATGFPQWKVGVPGKVAATPVVVDDRVMVVTVDGAILALGLRDGRTAWQADLGARVTGAPLVANGFLYVVSEQGLVAAYEAHAGLPRWNRTLPPFEELVAPVWAGGRIVLGDAAGNLHALHALTGATLWSVPVGSPVTATPVVAGNRVVVPTLGLKAYDVEAGRALWSQPAGSFVRSSPAYGAGVLVWGDPDEPGLAAAGLLTGERLWHAPTRADVRAPPVIAADVALGLARDGTVLAVRLRNGTALWSQDVGERTDAPLAVLEGRMVVARRDGLVRLYADDTAPEALEETALPTGSGSNGFVGLLPIFVVLGAPYVGLKLLRDRMRRQVEAELVARAGQAAGEPRTAIRPSQAGPVRVACPTCACRFGVTPRRGAVVTCPGCGGRSALRPRSDPPPPEPPP